MENTANKKEPLSEAKQRARTALTRPRLRFEPKSQEWLEAEKEKIWKWALTHAEAGKKMPDGTIYLGYFNDKDWFVAVEDAKDKEGNRLRLDFSEAAQYVRSLKLHGHDDWRLPPGKNDAHEPDILSEMFNNKSTGAFDNTYSKDSGNAIWYWSSTTEKNHHLRAWRFCFLNGRGEFSRYYYDVSCRPVRAVPRPL